MRDGISPTRTDLSEWAEPGPSLVDRLLTDPP